MLRHAQSWSAMGVFDRFRRDRPTDREFEQAIVGLHASKRVAVADEAPSLTEQEAQRLADYWEIAVPVAILARSVEADEPERFADRLSFNCELLRARGLWSGELQRRWDELADGVDEDGSKTNALVREVEATLRANGIRFRPAGALATP